MSRFVEVKYSNQLNSKGEIIRHPIMGEWPDPDPLNIDLVPMIAVLREQALARIAQLSYAGFTVRELEIVEHLPEAASELYPNSFCGSYAYKMIVEAQYGDYVSTTNPVPGKMSEKPLSLHSK